MFQQLSQLTKEQKSGCGVCVTDSCLKKEGEINLWDAILKAPQEIIESFRLLRSKVAIATPSKFREVCHVYCVAQFVNLELH